MYRGAKCLRNIGTAVKHLKKHLAVFIIDGSIYITVFSVNRTYACIMCLATFHEKVGSGPS